MAMEQEDAWLRLRHQVSRQRVTTTFRAFQESGTSVLLIKGYAASLSYPEPWRRVFSDIDICVSPDGYESARAVIAECNLDFGIDVHKGLRHLHPGSFEEVLARGRSMDVEGVQVRIPSPADHLIILSTHWMNDGGAKRERLSDIRYLVEANPDMDWESVLSSLPNHRRRWLGVTLGATIKFGGLSRPLVGLDDELLRIPGWVERVFAKEWADPEITPLYELGIDLKSLIRQVKKRIPPNPLEAIVECEGRLDSKMVPVYQALSFLKRVPKGLLMQTQRWRTPRRQS